MFGCSAWERLRNATTFISLALSDGRPPQRVAEYVGPSLAMLHKHYAAFIRNPAPYNMLSVLGCLGERLEL